MKKWLHLFPGLLFMLLGINNVFSQNACPPPDVGTASISKSTACEGEAFTLTYSLPDVNAGYKVTVNSPLSIAGSYTAVPANFGPVLAAPLSGNLVLADPVLACDPLINSGAINGNIALVDRGICFLYQKVLQAQAAGATGVIVVNNQPGYSINVLLGPEFGINIPVVMITQADGPLIKAALNNGPVNMTINPFSRQIWQAWVDANNSWVSQPPAGGNLVLTAGNPGTTVNGQPGDRFRVKASNACGDSYSNEVEIIYGVLGVASTNATSVCEGSQFTISYSVPNVNDGNKVTVNSPLSAAGSYSAVPASFGPVLAAPLTGNLVLANPSNACGSLTNAAEINGNIAVIDRGVCAFLIKVMEAQNAGAIAVIVVNNQPGIALMGGSDPNITIPALMISQAEGAIIKDALNNGPVNMTINPFSRQIWQAWDDATSSWITQGAAGGDFVALAANPGTTINGLPGDRYRVKVENACGENYSNEIEVIFVNQPVSGVASSSEPAVCIGGPFTLSYSVANQASLSVNSPSSIAGSYSFNPGVFSNALSVPLTENLVLANPGNACGALINAAAINGKIAVIDRGTCSFTSKVMQAQNAGAIAVIIINNAPGNFTMGGADPNITIPWVSISQEDGALIKAALNDGPVNVTFNPFNRQVWEVWDDNSSSWLRFANAGGDRVEIAGNPQTTINGLPGDRFRVVSYNEGCAIFSNEVEVVYVNGAPIAGVASSSAAAVCQGGEYTISYLPGQNYPSISMIGTALNGWYEDIAMKTTDGEIYTLTGQAFAEGEIKFRQDNDWAINWGNTDFPGGYSFQDGPNVPVTAGNYNVYFNRLSGMYYFELAENSIGIVGSALNGWNYDINMATFDGSYYILKGLQFSDGEVKFRAGNDWALNWGNIDFPNGEGFQDGPNIPVTAGKYDVYFFRFDGVAYYYFVPQSTEPNFKQVWQAWDDAISDWIDFGNAVWPLNLVATNPATTVNGKPGQRFRVMETNTCGTSYSNELEIAFVSYPVVSITAVPSGNVYTGGNPNTIYLGYGPQSVTLQTSVDMNVSYQWTGSGLNCVDCANPVFTPTAPGEYTFTLFAANEYGCGTNTSITITVKDVRVPGKNGKVYICHQNKSVSQTLEINANAVQDHLKHGDALGNCVGGDSKPGGKKKSAEDVGVVVGITVYPNPANNQVMVTFETEKAEPYTLRMTDITGRTVSAISGKSNAGKNQVPVNVSSWIPGTYLFILQNGSAFKTAKVIKQ